MSDDYHDLELPPAEEALARRLAELGPLLRQQERAEAEVDPRFARNLRSHLVLGEDLTPDPAFARALRARLLRSGSGDRRQTLARAGLTAAVIAAILIAFAVGTPRKAHTSAFAAGVPYPTTADLTFSYPSLPVVIHRLTPTVSLVHPAPGIPYAGRLSLVASTLSRGVPSLHAFRLAPPLADVATLGHRLGIRAHLRHMVADGATWAVKADGWFSSRQPLHSLAVSLATGELIYHDRRNVELQRRRPALDRDDAVGAVRRWLARLGWPAERMPVRSVGRVEDLPRVWKVVLGWMDVGSVATEEATVWVAPGGHIVEAWVWPPVTRGGTIPARPISAAWMAVAGGTLPLAIEGVSPRTTAGGLGALRRVAVVSVLSAGSDRSLYLVPTYRFEGITRLQGIPGHHTWYALAPGEQR